MKSLDAQKIALAKVADISAGHPIRSAVDDLPRGEIGVVQMRNVDAEAGVDWPSLTRVELPPGRRTEFLAPGEVIFATRGAKNYAVALGDVPLKAVCSPHFFVIRARVECVDPWFLAWQINQGPAQEYFQRGATGSYILNIRREVVERLEVALPPLSQQRSIAALAEAARREKRVLGALIDLRQRQMEALALGLSAATRG